MMAPTLPGLVRIVSYRGGLGNQLAQYCLARRVARELGFDLLVPPIPGFPNAICLGSGARNADPGQRYQRARTGHRLDLEALLADRSGRLIDLMGSFMRYEYFRPCKDENPR